MGLVLHKGGEVVSRADLDRAPLPPATATHVPVPHSLVVQTVEHHLSQGQVPITDANYALSHTGQRLFGVITLGGGTDYATVIGVRNSHDKSFPVGLCLGSRVFVCDNLAFSSEINISTKHSLRVLDRLPRLICDGVAKLVDRRGAQDRRITAYKEAPVDGSRHLHDLVMRAYRANAIPAMAITKVVAEYEAPRHEEFRDRTLWSFFNAVTEVLKDYGDLTRRTQSLHGVIDAEVGQSVLAV